LRAHPDAGSYAASIAPEGEKNKSDSGKEPLGAYTVREGGALDEPRRARRRSWNRKLVGVARASHEELLLDTQDLLRFLEQRFVEGGRHYPATLCGAVHCAAATRTMSLARRRTPDRK